MKIALIGEYSRLHLTLAEGLRALGHAVLVASDGDGHKQFERDIDLTRKSSGVYDTLSAFIKTNKNFRKFKNFDVVQLINPCFTTLSVGANKYYYNQLKNNNKTIFLGAFGDDSYWVKACQGNKIFKYSEFFVEGKSTDLEYNKSLIEKWIGTPRQALNEYIAEQSDGIVACLYEYYKSYEESFSPKLEYIPLPIHVDQIPFIPIDETPSKIRFFIGIDSYRSEYKGTSRMEKVLIEFAAKHSSEVEVIRAESVSYQTYQDMMTSSHVVLDQLYSHSPSVNPLQAMAMGKIAVSGGEPEMYDLMGDVANQPIINVHPTDSGIWDALEYVLANKSKLPAWSQASRNFVEQYHSAAHVAQRYLDFWNRG